MATLLMRHCRTPRFDRCLDEECDADVSWVKVAELHAGVLGGELPIDLTQHVIVGLVPKARGSAKGRIRGNVSVPK